ERDLKEIQDFIKQYNFSIIGTKSPNKFNSTAKKYTQVSTIISKDDIRIGPVSYPGNLLPLTQMDKFFHGGQYSKLDSMFCKKDKLIDIQGLKTMIRICSDVIIPLTDEGKADLILIPSSLSHPHFYMENAIKSLKPSLNEDAIIMYATPENVSNQINTGVYDLNIHNISEDKGHYHILQR
ncbi:MAG: hypothetical protein KKF65_07500, partial [Nanoarchaeota archaeon]|nr:hypothetical protein [Nanoarchaeota archaeon]